jgi:hypothetical protein
MFLAKAKRPNEMKEKGDMRFRRTRGRYRFQLATPRRLISCGLSLNAYNARNTMLIDFIKVLKKHPPLRAPQAQTG